MADSVTKKIRNTKPKVIKYLEMADKSYRDNDEELVARFWYDECVAMGANFKTFTALEFLKRYGEGKLTSADVITRARRKAQEENPELRGKNWVERHHKADKVKKEINNPDESSDEDSGLSN